jgi:hypothetical protein
MSLFMPTPSQSETLRKLVRDKQFFQAGGPSQRLFELLGELRSMSDRLQELETDVERLLTSTG